jgi:nitrate reductase delta subunit
MTYTSTYFNLVSFLMQYPDEAYLQALPELETVAGRLKPGREKSGIEAFLADLKTHSALQLQERYTAAFDLNPSTTLNLTYHRWGDSEKRAATLTRLKRLYMAAGYEIDTGELPDYLPLVLEFMASVSAAQRSEPIRQCLTVLETIVYRLKKIASPYAELLTPLSVTFRDQTEIRTAPGID